jgi:hypothetical protein
MTPRSFEGTVGLTGTFSSRVGARWQKPLVFLSGLVSFGRRWQHTLP